MTSFNYVLSFFVGSAYLDGLLAFLFRTRNVNISAFRGAFRRKVGLAILFVSFAAMTLLAGDIASYEGDRLLREASLRPVRLESSARPLSTYWISRALTLPLARLDSGMERSPAATSVCACLSPPTMRSGRR